MDNLNRAVVADLWPLYVSGDVSQDTRRFIEDVLSRDPEFAKELSKDVDLPKACPLISLSPDHELTTLARLKRRMAGPIWLMNLAILFSCFAFGRIVSDTSFDVSPRNFIITASIAACLWIAFFVGLYRSRRSIQIRWK